MDGEFADDHPERISNGNWPKASSFYEELSTRRRRSCDHGEKVLYNIWFMRRDTELAGVVLVHTYEIWGMAGAMSAYFSAAASCKGIDNGQS